MKHKKLIFVIGIIGMLFLSSTIDYNNRIYRHAKQGDIDAIYKIVMLTEGIDTIFTRDTLDAFRDTLLKHGHFEYIRNCLLDDFDKNKLPDYAYRDVEQTKKHLNLVYEKKNKWWDIGVQAGDPQCMFKRYEVARAKFRTNKTPEDSLEYVQYLNLCRDNCVYEADINEARYSKDPMKWLKAQCNFFFPLLVRNIHQKGFFQGSFHTIFTNIAKFPFEFCWDYLFSKHWWKAIVLVILLFIICIGALWSQILLNPGRPDLIRPVIWGLSLGITHGVFYFWSDQSFNYLWGKTVFSLWLPTYSDSFSAFIPIGINWYIIYKMARNIFEIWQKSGPNRLLTICLSLFLFFNTYYLTTAALALCILLWFFVVVTGAGAKGVASSPGILAASLKRNVPLKYLNLKRRGYLVKDEDGDWVDDNGEKHYVLPGGKVLGPNGEDEIV